MYKYMALTTMKEILQKANEKNYGVGAFVSVEHMYTECILEAAEQTKTPVLVMLPARALGAMSTPELHVRCTLDMLRSASVPAALVLDHGKDFDICMKAIHYGLTGIMFDGSMLPLEENIAMTRKIAEAAHACGVSIEGEIGHVGGAEGPNSSAGGYAADSDMYTTVEEAVRFANETGVDVMAVAIGTVHGVYKGTPRLDINRLRKIKELTNMPIAMHGGSGLPEEEYRKAVRGGVNKINFFTEMSFGASRKIKKVLEAHNMDARMHLSKLTDAAKKEMIRIMIEHIEIFETQSV